MVSSLFELENLKRRAQKSYFQILFETAQNIKNNSNHGARGMVWVWYVPVGMVWFDNILDLEEKLKTCLIAGNTHKYTSTDR